MERRMEKANADDDIDAILAGLAPSFILAFCLVWLSHTDTHSLTTSSTDRGDAGRRRDVLCSPPPAIFTSPGKPHFMTAPRARRSPT
jgi:hypothetical protein